MGRRQRHFNPAHVDGIRGNVVLDARFITGVADGAEIASWGSRPGGSITFTQGTAARRPLFSNRALGGQAAASFVQANTQWMSRGGSIIGSTNDYTIFGCGSNGSAVIYSQTANTSFIGAYGTAGYILFCRPQNITIINTSASGVTANSPTGGPRKIIAAGRDATPLLFATDSTTLAQGSAGGTLNMSTSRNGTLPNTYYTSDMGALAICGNSAPSDPLRNRIMHHYAYSFKQAM